MRVDKHRLLAVFAADPFLVAGCLIVLMLLAPLTGMIGPASNTFFVTGGAATGIGAALGISSLLTMRKRKKWVRFLVGLSYVPTVLISLLLIGA
jgi:hypothetical protein